MTKSRSIQLGANIEATPETTVISSATSDWRVVDRALREIHTRRSELDAEEARWLREAEALQIWHPLGMVSILDYLERVLGYAPRTAQDRLRVARALGTLPRLTTALAAGKLCYSAARELTRVATPDTEAAWITEATGKNLRQIEELVADRRPGDHPDDAPAPTARTHVVRFELAAETFALLRQSRVALDDEHGTNLSDNDFVAALCSAALDQRATGEPTGRARYQIAVTVCSRCRAGWQQGGGASLSITPAAVERAMCDAQHIGSIDGEDPERAYQDIPPRVARFVWHRDGGRCRIDGCRSGRGLELHHLVHREHRGSHDASNIILACSSCHHAHHAGLLLLSGTADNLTVHRPAAVTASRQSRPWRSLAEQAAHSPDCSHSDRTCVLAISSAVSDTGRHAADHLQATSAPAHVDAANTPVSDTVPYAADHVQPAASPAPRRAHLGAANTPASDTVPYAADHVQPAASPVPRRAHVDAANTPVSDTVPYASDHVQPATSPVPRRAHVDAIDAIGFGAEHAARPADAPSDSYRVTSKLDMAVLRAETKLALTGLGWKPAVANAAIAAALATVGTQVSLEQLICESLRRCPTPRA